MNGICGIEMPIGRAFSPGASDSAIHGALPHAGIDCAVGAFAGVLFRALGAHAGMDCAVGAFPATPCQGPSERAARKRRRRGFIPAWGNAPGNRPDK